MKHQDGSDQSLGQGQRSYEKFYGKRNLTKPKLFKWVHGCRHLPHHKLAQFIKSKQLVQITPGNRC